MRRSRTRASQRSARGLRVVLHALACWLAASSASAAGERVLYDFEREGLGSAWTAQGEIQVSRAPRPEGEAAGHAARIAAGAGGLFATRRGALELPWPELEQLALSIHRSAEAAAQGPTTIELWLFEGDGRARFWRKLELEHAGWARVAVPLRYFRHGQGRLPEWSSVDRLALYFRGEAELWVDDIAVVDDPEGPGARVPLSELRALAFPDIADDALQRVEDERFELLTDAPELDAARLAAQLRAVVAALEAELGFLGRPANPPRLVVFREEEAYRRFPAEYARAFASEGPRPAADGFTFLGVATGAWDPAQGTLRPTYTHELVHAWFEAAARLDNSGEWLQEGLAVRYQLRFHPQPGFAAIVREGLAREDYRTPLEELCDGEPIPTNRYWQALTALSLLMDSERYGPRFHELIRAFQASGSTALGPQLEPVLDSSWEQLEADWRAHRAARYAAEDER